MDTSVEELRRGYEELKASGFPLNMVFDFGEKLGNSAQTAYHFELVLEDWERPRPQRWHPEDFFRWHRQEGIDYLRGLLTSEDRRCAVSAAYLLAELLPRGRYDDQEKITGELISACHVCGVGGAGVQEKVHYRAGLGRNAQRDPHACKTSAERPGYALPRMVVVVFADVGESSGRDTAQGLLRRSDRMY